MPVLTAVVGLFVSAIVASVVAYDAYSQIPPEPLYIENCFAVVDDEALDRVVMGADVVVPSALPLGVDSARITFEFFKGAGSRRSELLVISTSEEKQVIGLAKQSFNMTRDLDRALDSGRYALGCTLEANGGNIAIHPDGWNRAGDTVWFETTVLDYEEVGSTPFHARLHADRTKGVEVGETVLVSLEIAQVQRPLNATLTMQAPPGTLIAKPLHSADCRGSGCESYEYQLSPSSSSRFLSAEIIINETGVKEIGAVIEWHEEGSDAVSSYVEPLYIETVNPKNGAAIIKAPTSVIEPDEPTKARINLVEEFWLHIVVGTVAAMLLAFVGWTTRHLHIKRIWK